MKNLKHYTFFIFTIVFNALTAQEKMDTVFIESMRIELSVKKTGKNITVITQKDLQKIAATSIDEVLQTVAGVEIQSRGGFGVQADILMRGTTFTQVLILLDGMKMNDPLTSHFNGYIPVTVAEIEKIEVLRGPAAAIYGADAVGGVINIITKVFSNQKVENANQGKISYGQNELISGSQGFFKQKGNYKIGAGASILQSTGQLIPETMTDSNTVLGSYNNYFDLKTIGMSYAYNWSEAWQIKFRTAYDFRDFAARYFYTTSSFDKSTEKVNNWWNQMQIIHLGKHGVTDLNLAYKYNTDQFVFSPDFPSTNNHSTKFLNFTLNHQRHLNEELSLQVGTQFDNRSIVSNDRGDHRSNHVGMYLMAAYQKNRLNMNASIRGDYDDNYSFETTIQTNASYVFDKMVVRASLGNSIRAADFTERYVSNNLENLTPGRSLGNPDLLPEKAWSEEIGLDFYPSHNLAIQMTGFLRQSSNLIDYTLTNQSDIGSVSKIGSLQNGADYFFAQNLTNLNTKGIELESSLNLLINNRTSLNASLGYTYLDTDSDEDFLSVYVSSHAKHLFTANLNIRLDRFNVGINGLYKQRQGQIATEIASELENDYGVFHAKASLNITKEIKLFSQVQNLFDVQYQNILGARMPLRWMIFGLTWNI